MIQALHFCMAGSDARHGSNEWAQEAQSILKFLRSDANADQGKQNNQIHDKSMLRVVEESEKFEAFSDIKRQEREALTNRHPPRSARSVISPGREFRVLAPKAPRLNDTDTSMSRF